MFFQRISYVLLLFVLIILQAHFHLRYNILCKI